MAESKRRGEEPADDNVEGDDLDAAVDGDAGKARGSKRRAADDEAKGGSAVSRSSRGDSDRVGIFGRIGRFFREVVAELRKVIWPTRKELVTYTSVVIVFLTVMIAIVVGFDFVFAKVVLYVFGNPG